MVVFVILGVLLSTLHQSSLGTLYLIMPNKLHPFWYSPLLPVFFFLSAIAVGLAMTIFESSMSSKYFGRELELPILRDLGRVLVVVLALYGILKFEDFYHRGVLKLMFVPGYEQRFFLLEIFLVGAGAAGSSAGAEDPRERARPVSGGGADAAGLRHQSAERHHHRSGKRRRRPLRPQVDRSGDHRDVRRARVRHLRPGGQVPAYLPRGEGTSPGTPRTGCTQNSRCLSMQETDKPSPSSKSLEDAFVFHPRWIQRLGRSVSAKLMVSIFVVMLLIFALLGYFSIRLHRKNLEAAALVSAEQQSEVLRRSASHYMLNNDRNGLYEMMLNMADQPGVMRVRILNPQGVISYSTAPAEVGNMVDKGAEACYGCHAQSQPLARLNRSDRFRVYRAEQTRILGVITPIENQPACSNAACHAHPGEHADPGRARHQSVAGQS